MKQDWDAIVIGSGIGGLTAADVLARVGGWRVVVLERHSQSGGQTQVFRRGGASWDVGVHYVGNVAPGDEMRGLFDAFSDARLDWIKMPHGYDRFVYPGRDFTVPADPAEYLAALIAEFPDEEAGLRGYFRDLAVAERQAMTGITQQMMPAPIAAWARLRLRLTGRHLRRTTAQAVARRIQSPELRALLTSQWGDYGVPPAISAFAMHALVASGYLRGAWFPAGGSGQFARTFEPAIEAAGGGVLVSHEVTSILIEEGRAVGVHVVDRRGPVPVERDLRAPVIISDAGAEMTYTRLLPVTGPIGRATRGARARLDRPERPASAVSVYLRLSQPVSALGIQGENVWIHGDFNQDDLRAETQAVLLGRPNHAFCSFPSARSGDDRWHTAEIIAGVSPDAFAPWSGTAVGARGPKYEALKERMADGLIGLAEKTLPGLSALIEYREVSTPLTFEYYTGYPEGRYYGAAAVPERHRPGAVTARTPVPGLLLAGTSAACLGVVGAMAGGVAAASRALGARGYPLVQRYVDRRKAEHYADAAPEGVPNALVGRYRCVLASRTVVSPTARRLDFQLDEPWDFRPGQYLRLRVAPYQWRDYSVIAAGDRSLSLLISTRTGGDGSQFADQAPLGTETAIEGPFGSFQLRPGRRHRVFVATGTGLAPLLGMFAQLRESGELADAELYFGCPSDEEDLTLAFDVVPPATTTCLSRGPVPVGPGAVAGPSAVSGDAPDDPTPTLAVAGSSSLNGDAPDDPPPTPTLAVAGPSSLSGDAPDDPIPTPTLAVAGPSSLSGDAPDDPTPALAVAGDAPRRDHPAGAPGPRRVVAGRVTAVLADAHLDAAASDFYVCGSAAMVRDVTRLLRARGATEVLTEPY